MKAVPTLISAIFLVAALIVFPHYRSLLGTYRDAVFSHWGREFEKYFAQITASTKREHTLPAVLAAALPIVRSTPATEYGFGPELLRKLSLEDVYYFREMAFPAKTGQHAKLLILSRTEKVPVPCREVEELPDGRVVDCR